MTKIDIFSGFLGAGKTTLIKKLIKEAYIGEKLVLIENEFGDIGIDGGFMQDAGIEVTEMNSGCICCSLVGDFGEALKKVLDTYNPDRILIEPSGVGKLSDVIKAVKDIKSNNIVLNSFTTVVDAKKCKMYMKNFGEFFNNQIENAATVILSHTASLSPEKINHVVKLIKEHNPDAEIVTTDWELLTGKQILSAIEKNNTLSDELQEMLSEHHHHGECHCLNHEHHSDDCHCHEHEHHHHDNECHCHDHNHHHHENECHCHEHNHNADEVFTSFGTETANVYTKEQILNSLKELDNSEIYGNILRAKGILAGVDEWIYFDYVPGEYDVRSGSAAVIGRLCVIGSNINKDNIIKLFAL